MELELAIYFPNMKRLDEMEESLRYVDIQKIQSGLAAVIFPMNPNLAEYVANSNALTWLDKLYREGHEFSRLYFGQEFGERGMEREGFSGVDGRTSIFDYWRVPTVQQWWADGKCCSKHIDPEVRNLYQQYKKILQLSANEDVFTSGKFYDLMYVNHDNPYMDANRVYAFVRSNDTESCLVVCNFSDRIGEVGVNIPQHAFDFLSLPQGELAARDLLTGMRCKLTLSAQEPAMVRVGAWSAAIFSITNNR